MILHGVDFSGADGGGAAKIRIVERDFAKPRGPIVSRGRADRRGLLRQIRERATDGRRHVWRIDAPFSLPIETLDEFHVPHDWMAMARWMRDFGSPRGWRHDIRSVSRREPKRECDRAERTPMAPMNLRVFKQTWTLIAEVLLPLAEEGVRIEPVMPGDPTAATTICEGCPASTLHRFGWPTRAYKGGGDPPALVRESIVASLRRDGMTIPDALAAEAIADTEGDLLDAMILVTPPVQTVVPREATIEAWVY
ncbi:MAG: hypothetical protein JNM94_17025 [Phycisphaerae bacterium]|nr:hypothetical protein [Phycisphaerae bacterium]